MLTMSQSESGALLMAPAEVQTSAGRMPANTVRGSSASDCDSESEDLPNVRIFAARLLPVSATTAKRNKRKNFQPRSIAYDEKIPRGLSAYEEDGGSVYEPRPRMSSGSSVASDYCALDLSGPEIPDTTINNNTNSDNQNLKASPNSSPDAKNPSLFAENFRISERNLNLKNYTNSDDLLSSRRIMGDRNSENQDPINFRNCSRTRNNSDNNYRNNDSEIRNSPDSNKNSDSNNGVDFQNCRISGDHGSIPMDLSSSKKTDETRSAGNDVSLASVPFLTRPYFTRDIPESSDLREYAKKTFKDLLEIYGLNGETAAELTAQRGEEFSQNFRLEKFTESSGRFAIRKSCSSEPSTPPHSPVTSFVQDFSSRPKSIDSPFLNKLPTSPHLQTPPRALLPQNMAAIFALANMKEQLINGSTFLQTQDVIKNNSPLSLASPNNTGMNIFATDLGSSMNKDCQSPVNGIMSRVGSASSSDYSRYVKRYYSAADCGSQYCADLNYREHFHCTDCNSRVFLKKEEMIRHFKWHKKRDESLQHGFMRYSPSDDCSDRFVDCTHNKKQTHYHCIQGSCDKVYISTSDVQMHANYHRKDSAIIQEGFQRLRATQECRTPYCGYFGQRTTHFHCRREGCQFTFKNKADMEKHKTYHIKDEQLARDGFKKFLKPDPCGFDGCRFSQLCNHIHCIRDGCSYVLHSSGQLSGHKRKHERKDTELAYRKFKLSQQGAMFAGTADQLSHHLENPLSPNSPYHLFQNQPSLHEGSYSNSSSEGGRASPTNNRSPFPSFLNTLPHSGSHFGEYASSDQSMSADMDECWYRYTTFYSSQECCVMSTLCTMANTDHYHCRESGCNSPIKGKDIAENHARMHETQERLCETLFQEGVGFCQEDSCPPDKHYHCTWEGCYEAIYPHERLDHLQSHEITSSQYNSLDTLFRQKRGRPPKNRMIQVWNDFGGNGMDTPQAIFTSFKLPKLQFNSQTDSQQEDADSSFCSKSPSPQILKRSTPSLAEEHRFEEYVNGCPDRLCAYFNSALHFHCKRPRCFFATNLEHHVLSHANDFHEQVEIEDGYIFFDTSLDCRLDTCLNNKVNRHFHCLRPGCGYTFIKATHMAEHTAYHQRMVALQGDSGPPTEADYERSHSVNASPQKENTPKENLVSSPEALLSESPNSKTVVKAAGTFYPLSGFTSSSSSPRTISATTSIAEERTSEPTVSSLPEWLQLERHELFTNDRPCCRAFCKLKRKPHYHCNACNQAFSENDKLRTHIVKHASNATTLPFTIKPEPLCNDDEESEDTIHPSALLSVQQSDVENSNEGATHISSPPPGPYQNVASYGAAMVAAQQLAMQMSSQGIPFLHNRMPTLYTSPSGLMFAAPPGFNPHHHAMLGNGLIDPVSGIPAGVPVPENTIHTIASPLLEMTSEMKKARMQSSMRILRDEPVPEGYLRFRFNEDCQYPHCGYREHQTHFHCVRRDCGYSFCDKTRFVQHTARHERLDTLMGGDFKQYRANVPCGRPDCSYAVSLGSSQNKASHFHCCKCAFVCTDTNKVVAHRRMHQKNDSINAAGFEKYTPAQSCSQAETCVHSGKQTHYHCLTCNYAVLGVSQIGTHNSRHHD